MIITWILTATVLISLFSGKISAHLLLIAAVSICSAGYLFMRRHNHHHQGLLTLDSYAQRSQLNQYSAGLKAALAVGTVFFCIAADSVAISLAIFLMMGGITVCLGKTSLRYYISLLVVPSSFVLLSGIAILYQVSDIPHGIIDIPWFDSYLSITPTSQTAALSIVARSFGALSCLYTLSLSTPIYELIHVLRKIKVPDIVIELMYLIYRYLFILLSMYENMIRAAQSRLAGESWRTLLRTMLQCSANLLFLSLRKSVAYLDAMESRCYDGQIRFLEQTKEITKRELSFSIAYVLLLGCLWLFIKSSSV